MFRTDQPITNLAEDLLERSSYACAISDAMLSYKSQDSLTVGLYGKWGHGKTSVINLVVEQIEQKSEALPKDKTPIVLRFNPWNFSDQDQLITQFFQQLSSELGRKDHGKDAKKAGKLLTTYSKLMIPLSLVPQISVPALMLSKVFKSVGEAASSWGTTKGKSLSGVKKELNDLLIKLERKVVIIIDDIDRLNNNEIRQIFQLVKSVGDFSNTVYFLSFDKDVVIEALRKVQKGDGLEYLEKVIQVPFTLPKVSHSDVEKLFFKEVNELFGETFEGRFDSEYWSSVYHSAMKHFFENIRDVNRFVNVLSFEFNLLKEEVNPVDFLAITALKVFLPDYHQFISENKSTFVGLLSDRSATDEKSKIRESIEVAIKNVNSSKRTIIQTLTEKLFPRIRTVFDKGGYASDFLLKWRSEFRVCTEENFDVYFRLAVSRSEISRSEMKSYIAVVENKEQFQNVLIELSKSDKSKQFLDKLLDYIEGRIDEQYISNLLSGIVNVGDLFITNRDNEGAFFLDNRVRIQYIIRECLKRYATEDERFTVMMNVVENSSQSLYSFVRFISVESGDKSGALLSDEQLTKLQEVALQKIRLWKENGRLVDHSELMSMLYRWKEWADESEAKGYVKELTDNKETLVKFLEKTLSQVSSSVAPYLYWKLSLSSVSSFIDPLSIIYRVREIRNSEAYKELDEKEQLAVRLFIKAVETGHQEVSDHDD